MGTLYQLSIILGILVSYFINYLLRGSGPSNWRWMFLSGVLPAVIFLLLMTAAPETPRFLVRSGRREQALTLLRRLLGPELAEAELRAIEESHQVTSVAGRASMQRRGVRRALSVAFVLAILIHFSGINTVIDYAPVIFQSAGWTLDTALISTFLVGVTELVFTCISFWAIDRFGRKPLYITGSLGMAVSLSLLMFASMAGLFHGAFVLVLILLYLAFFSACIGGVFWTLVAEIFPNDVRSESMIVPVLTQWVANAIVVLFFPFVFLRVGKEVTFGFLAVMSLAQAFFTRRFVPETKGLPLETIESYWVGQLEV